MTDKTDAAQRRARGEARRNETNRDAITVVHDGLTAFGFVHNRGAVIEIDERMREDTIDRDGNLWLNLDEKGQRRQFGRQMFVHGDHARAIREADERAQETAAATKAAAAEHNGLAALRDVYREEDEAQRSRKLVTRSRTTAGSTT